MRKKNLLRFPYLLDNSLNTFPLWIFTPIPISFKLFLTDLISLCLSLFLFSVDSYSLFISSFCSFTLSKLCIGRMKPDNNLNQLRVHTLCAHPHIHKHIKLAENMRCKSKNVVGLCYNCCILCFVIGWCSIFAFFCIPCNFTL